MRAVRWTGCSGAISLEQTSNDRTFNGLDVSQNVLNEETGLFESKTIGSYNPLSVTLFDELVDVVWPDGTTNIPNDSRKRHFDCPFNEDLLETSFFGRLIMYFICFGLLFIMCIVSAIIWTKYWRVGIVPLTRKIRWKSSDFILAASILIEGFQYSGLGPEDNLFRQFLFGTGPIVGYNLELLIRNE